MAADAQWNKLMSLWSRMSDGQRRNIVRLARAFRDDQEKPGQPFATRYAAIMNDLTLSTPQKMQMIDSLLDDIARMH